MAFYLTQWKYPQAAIKAMVDNPQDREVVVRKLMEGLGGTLHQFYFSFGRYDGLTIAEFPDDESMAAALMTVAAVGGAVALETSKLLTSKEAQNAMRRAHDSSTGYTPAQS